MLRAARAAKDGTGYLELREVTPTRGGADGARAALATRGELLFVDEAVTENLAEEPGGGLFSRRGITVRRPRINGNLANDDGGGVYARRDGVKIYDSVMSNNLVDGSGGAVGSTGDILVVQSQVDGNAPMVMAARSMRTTMAATPSCADSRTTPSMSIPSEWDDPDYQLAAFVGHDRPSRREIATPSPVRAPTGCVPARVHAARRLEVAGEGD